MRVNAYQQRRRSASLTETGQFKSSNNKAKRKSRWKLKFHHQTLPSECQRHSATKLQLDAKLRMPLPLPIAPCPRYATRSVTLAPRATRIGTTAEFAEVPLTPTNPKDAPSTSDGPVSSPPPMVRYTDLPYMGEMTLDNAVPRRGRKPKKADICHLIYKNYGMTVLDEPLNLCIRDARLENEATELAAGSGGGSGSDGDGCCARDAASLIRDFGLTADARCTLRQKRRVGPAALPNGSPTSATRVSKKKKKSQPLRGRQLARKNRKSMTREKLERTFEERGFLIQTQQLESAQGATYCKFRQLRKFTRYLFRSWKHHLPDDVVDKQ